MTDARWLDGNIGLIDVMHRDKAGLIACYVMQVDDGLALIETGPGITVDNLLAGISYLGLSPDELRHILLTHIHLDHAGAAGTLLERYPNAQLYVHERGARHMIDPSRLLASAQRIYGAMMDALWGPFLPCPAERVNVVTDGDRLDLGGTSINVLYTPGHASHHVSYDCPDAMLIFAGDVAGVRIPPSSLVWPPTPPPDIDIPAWHQSIQRLRERSPERVMITHFGEITNVPQNLDELDQRLDDWTEFVDDLLGKGKDRDQIAAALEERVTRQIEAEAADGNTGEAAGYVMPFKMSVDGLLRYLQKRDEAPRQG